MATIPSVAVIPSGYKASKLYSVLPTDGGGDLDVVRATTATRVNSDGLIENVSSNVPRLDYTNGGCPSLLVEPQRTNLLTYSEDFSDASWSKVLASITSNTTISPNGTLTADKLVENTLNDQHRLDQTTSSVIGTNTFSVFAKKSERDSLWLRIGVAGAYFDLTNGVISNIVGVTATIENYANDWYRCIIVRTSTVANEVARINLAIGTVSSYLGDGTSGLYIWGAQLEAGSNATSYIPTVASTVTRNADVISKTGISDLIGQSEGTIFYEFSVPIVETVTRAFSLSGASISNRINISIFANSIFVRVDVGGVNQVNANATIIVTNMNKIAFRYKENDFSLYVNGVNILTDTSGITFPASTLDRISNVQPDSTSPFNGNIKQVRLFKTALTDQELITLTTL